MMGCPSHPGDTPVAQNMGCSHWATTKISAVDTPTNPRGIEAPRTHQPSRGPSIVNCALAGFPTSVTSPLLIRPCRPVDINALTRVYGGHVQPGAGLPGLSIGRLLLAELIAHCEARGATQMIAVIGDAANAASIRAAPRAGFRACRAVDRRRLEIRALAGRVVDATATGLWRRIALPYKRMTTIEPTPSADKSKALATWIAIVGGSLGLHRL